RLDSFVLNSYACALIAILFARANRIAINVRQQLMPLSARKMTAGPDAVAAASAADRKHDSPRLTVSSPPAADRSVAVPSAHSTRRGPPPGRATVAADSSARYSRNSGAGES